MYPQSRYMASKFGCLFLYLYIFNNPSSFRLTPHNFARYFLFCQWWLVSMVSWVVGQAIVDCSCWILVRFELKNDDLWNMCPSIYKESHCINACLVRKLHPSPADATELEMRSYYLRRRGVILYQGIIQNCKPTFIMLLVLVITSIFHYCTFMKTQQKSKVDVLYLSVSTIEFTWQIPYFGFNNVQQAPRYEDVPTGSEGNSILFNQGVFWGFPFDFYLRLCWRVQGHI